MYHPTDKHLPVFRSRWATAREQQTRSGPIGLVAGERRGRATRGLVRQAKNIFCIWHAEYLCIERFWRRIIFFPRRRVYVSRCTCIRKQVHVCAQPLLFVTRASRALYTIIVKNFREIVSRNTCSFLEMLRHVEDAHACMHACMHLTYSSNPNSVGFFFFFFFLSPVTLATRGFHSFPSLPTEFRRIRDILKYRYNRALVSNSRYTLEERISVPRTGGKSYLTADFKFTTFWTYRSAGNIRARNTDGNTLLQRDFV